jgi:crotonobetainyl-CoA:carnitine CoA-transferase CaiB-like acyl-CoA transferase
MRAHRVPAGPPATVGEAVEKARRRGQVVDLPAGAYGILPTVAAPFLFDGERAAPTSSAPALGEHTAEVLREAGMSREEIRELLQPSG